MQPVLEGETMNVLSVKGLCKSYPGFSLQNISFDIAKGTIMGFVGRNGAGKSTTLKSILNLVHMDTGRVEFFGLELKAHEREIKQRIGYIGGAVNFYKKKKIKQIVEITKSFYKNWDDEICGKYMKLFSLDMEKTPSELSEGMKVKLSLVLALSHGAELLILDEPTSGLDPVSSLGIPLLYEKLGRAVYKVGGKDLGKYAVCICLVKFFKAIGKQTEGGKGEDALCTLFLQLKGYVDHRVARSDHIVNNDNILANQIAAEIFVCLDGVSAVYDLGVVAALVEHTDVNAHHRGVVGATVHCALIGRDDHQILFIDRDIGEMTYQCLDHLVGGMNILKSAKRNGVLHARIVCIEGDDVRYAHTHKLLKSDRAVERFSARALMLTSLVKHRHDYRYATRFARDSGDNALQIGVMVIGAHRNVLAVHLVGNAIVKGIAVKINVVTAHRLVQKSLCLARTEAGAVYGCKEGFLTAVSSPFLEVVVNLRNELLASLHTDNAQISVKCILHCNPPRAEFNYNAYIITYIFLFEKAF